MYLITLAVVAIVGLAYWHFFFLSNYGSEIRYKEFIESYLFVNVIIFVYTICLFIFCLFNLNSINKNNRLEQLLKHTFVYVLIEKACFHIPALYPVETIIPHLYYHYFIAILFGLLFLIELYLLIKSKRHNVTTYPPVNYVDLKWDLYINSIINFIKKKDTMQECFAIGVASAWGSGKTTFLKQVRNEVCKDKNFVAAMFNPWKMTSTAQINSEFFDLLVSILKKENRWKNDNTISLIYKYSELLYSLPSVPKEVTQLLSLFPKKQTQTLTSLHSQIDENLSQCPKKIVIIIDDLDRLAFDELFEVLKLIRISANFKNIIFIAAYDKSFITNNLTENHLPKAEDYLKKIINLEISLPAFENRKIGDILYDKTKRYIPANRQKEIENAIYTYDSEYGLLINRYLNNFRDIERFTNHFSTIVKYINDNGSERYFNYHDLFWVEVLHYAKGDVYNLLKTNYSILLAYNKNNVALLTYTTQPNQHKNLILNYLFSNSANSATCNSIVWANNIRLYFAYRYLDDNFTIVDFVELLQLADNRSELYQRVYKLLESQQRASLIQVLYLQPIMSATWLSILGEPINFLRFVLTIAIYFEVGSFVFNRVEKLLHQLVCMQKNGTFLFDADVIKNEMTYYIDNYGGKIIWNKLLAQMSYCEDVQMMDYYGYYNDTILDTKTLMQLATKNFEKYSFDKENYPITTIFTDNPLSQFVEASAYISRIDSSNVHDEKKQYSNLLPNAIKDIYKRDNKYNSKEFEMMIKPLLSEYIKSEGDENYLIEVHTKVEKLFGSDYSFNSFIDGCFDLSQEDIKYWLIDTQLRPNITIDLS